MRHTALHRLIHVARSGQLNGLVRAQWSLMVAQALVWTRPTGALVENAPGVPTGERRPPRTAAVRIARSVQLAGRYGVFRPQCLVRSIAIQRLLNTDGIQGSIIRIGVRRSGVNFTAHAWVELDGRVLGDDTGNVSKFTRMVDVQAS